MIRLGWRALLGGSALAVAFACATVPGHAQQQATEDVWKPVRFLLGEWEGTSQGQPGTGTARRSYTLVLKDRFIHERNVTTYPPQAANQAGEVHEHWSLLSYDGARKALVLRQFHQEGFVNQYVLDTSSPGTGKLVFESERFENLDSGWRARETYEARSPDEFVETFEIAPPGGPLEVYSRTTFRRVKRGP